MADKDTPIYDKTRMRGTTWVDATRILFNMGSELEEQVDGMDYEGVKQDLADEIINRQNADTQLGNRIDTLGTQVNQNKSDITQIKETINQIEDNATALGASVAVIQTDVAENKGNIQANAGKIEVLENEYAGFNSEQISLRTDLTKVQADVEGIKTSLVSDVITKAGSTVGTIIVELEREDGTKISAQDFNYGKPTSMELLQGSSEGMMKAQFTLSDGTTVQSNDFQVLEQITGDVYITSFTFKNGSSQGKISAVIGLSDGRTLNANDFQLPTDPQIQSNITNLLSRMNAVEEKNKQQDSNISALSTRMNTAESNIAGNDADIAQLKSEDETIKGDITSLDARVTAIEDTPGVGKFELGKLGTIMGSSDDGKISANPDGTGSVNGWDSVATKDELTEIQSDIQEQITNIKPTVTVNDSVSPPTISVAVNGSTSTANLPSGGSEWEELNLSNLPTDFTDNDFLKIDIGFFAILSFTIENWNSTIEESDIGELNRGSIIIEGGIDSNPSRPSLVYSAYYARGGIVLSTIEIDTTLNSDDLFKLEFYAFNGASHIYKTIKVNRSNVSSYINHLWRKKR